MRNEQLSIDPAAEYAAAQGRPSPNGVVAVEQQRSIAEVQAAVIMARQFPRDPVLAINRIKMACQRPALAEVAMYTYARGGSDVTGPSIRLAEAIAQAWGNIQFGIRELSQANGESTMQAYAWDLETNARQEKTFQVKHERHTRSGVKKLNDPRDIYELAANNGARRLRACILGIIPGDVVEEAVEECQRTLAVNVDLSEKKVAKLVEAFDALGVTKEMLEERIQRPMDSITPALYVGLTKIGNSLKDGISKPADWFRVTAAPTTVRWSPKQMQQAMQEIVSGNTTVEEIQKQWPTLAADQVEEIKAFAQ